MFILFGAPNPPGVWLFIETSAEPLLALKLKCCLPKTAWDPHETLKMSLLKRRKKEKNTAFHVAQWCHCKPTK